MIPSTTNQLLVAEDWKKIYQSFRNAEFKSYDFETLRRTMINYLRENYPEEFNDYIDSSEYIALVDLIAFLGQNLSFRVDLNARENFLETAERRDSILRLARLINYNAKRNIPANGFLKITSISTTENVIDSNGINLANSIIGWNDPTNSNWYQQFISIINASMASPSAFGKPYAKAILDGIATEQYKINTNGSGVPLYSFNKNIAGTQMSFEIVPATFSGKTYVYEDTPLPGNQFGIIFKNDNKGSGSANTGFFVHFRQGSMNAQNFSVTNPVPNELVGVNVSDINDTDVWLWGLSADGTKHQTMWSKVDATTGNNVIYNSLNKSVRDIYSVLSRDTDQIDLSFADGSFGNLPNGPFRLYYRQSNGLSYTIKPEQMNNISVQIPYTSQNGQSHTLNIILSLQYSVTNSSASESNADIRLKAPQAYYTQNRMITAEDYNIAPLTVDADILKIKSINRIASGVSKYYELSDVSGKYSNTNIFANDGVLYSQDSTYNFEFTFSTRNEVISVIRSQLEPIIRSPEFKSFYLSKYPELSLDNTGYSLAWHLSNKTTNQTRGYFTNNDTPATLGDYASSSLSFFKPGALIKMVPPFGQYFLPNGTLTSTPSNNTTEYRWVQIANVTGDGANSGAGNLANGTGPVTLTGAVYGDGTLAASTKPASIIPKFQNILTSALETELANLALSKRNFGLSFDSPTRTWYIINDANIDLKNPFDLLFQKDITNVNKDASWMIAFEWTGKKYIVRYRVTEYVFESDKETAFFIDKSKKNYDFTNDTVIKDKIVVLGINSSPNNISSIYNITVASTTGEGSVLEFNIQKSGTGKITSTPSVSVSGGIGGDFVPILKDGYIDSIRVINSGTGYVVGTTATVSVTDAALTSLPLNIDYNWQIDTAVIEPDGYVEPKKVLVSFFDYNEDGQIDDPSAFDNIVQPDTISSQTGYKDKFVYFKLSADKNTYQLVDTSISENEIIAYPNQYVDFTRVENQLYYFYDDSINTVVRYTTDNGFVADPSYYARSGRSKLKFHYIHNSGDERRIDPAKSSIIDVYLLTKAYDLEYRNWLAAGTGTAPLPPTTQSLEENYAETLEPIKAISDEIIYHPVNYKVLFGSQAESPLQATFKAVRNPARPTSTTDIQTRILSAIEDFFTIENWDFGQTFNFGELSTYVMNLMTPDITNFVIVPKSDNGFGSLYQVTCLSNEIFVSGTTVNDIQVIDNITSTELKAVSTIVTSS